MNEVVIITGALGFIGEHIAREFKENNFYVIGMGHGNAPKSHFEKVGIDEWYEADISIESLKQIEKKAKVIVHCAGGSTVGISIQNPHLDYHKTVNSTLEILEFIRVYSPKTSIIYLSSAAVYGSKEDDFIKENDATSPVSPYGFHKLASESICRSYAHCFGIKVAIIRLFSIYGAGLKKQLLWDASNKIINAKHSVSFFGTGEETRDWLHIDDTAKLVMHIARVGFDYIVLNGAYGKRVTVKETLLVLIEKFNMQHLQLVFSNEFKEGDPKYYHADIAKALNTGWVPQTNLQSGIESYVNWFKNKL